MRKTFKYRIYLTPKQETALSAQLESCRMLYNHFIKERKNAWEDLQETIPHYTQQNSIPLLKQRYPALKNVYSTVLQNVSVRVDLAYQAYFRRCRSGIKPGYPRFKGYGSYDSITYPQYGRGVVLKDNRIALAKVGHIKTIFHRPLEGSPKTVIIKRSSTNKWYISFSCEIEKPEPLPISPLNVGVDVGLETFAYMSDNTKIGNPRFFRKEEKQLAKANRKFAKFPKPAKFVKSSKERIAAKKVVSRVHERVKFKRVDFTHQETRKIISKYQIIAVEDLHVNRMVHNHCLSKSIYDASWSKFFDLLFSKAEWAGRTVVAINPAYTSQDCSGCGHREKKSLGERMHNCKCCGLIMNRDLNAAINILRLGLQSLGIQSLEA